MFRTANDKWELMKSSSKRDGRKELQVVFTAKR
jgi:hypothetical protein